MALRSGAAYGPFCVQDAYHERVEVDTNGLGVVRSEQSFGRLGKLSYHMRELQHLLSTRSPLTAFDFTSPYANAAREI